MNVLNEGDYRRQQQPPQQTEHAGVEYMVRESQEWSQVPPQYMPWGHSPRAPAAPLVTFSARLRAPASTTPILARMHCKRKFGVKSCVPTKQYISEERMAAHMSRLHISTESHPGEQSSTEARDKRLYVCEEMRRLQTESILPSALIGRLERPCMAVMLWQPPSKHQYDNFLPLTNTSSSAGIRIPEEDENENQTNVTDLNQAMDMNIE